jgi:hypothetical protein
VTYRTEVEHHAAAIRRRCEGASVDTVRVICSAWQEPFLTWMGYEVVATYGPPDQATAARAAALADVAKDIDVVVDNLQSGPPAGQALARDVGARHVVLTNFVLGSNYLEALEANVDTLLGEADN